MTRPSLPADPAAPMVPMGPITAGGQSARVAGSIAGGAGLSGVLYAMGMPGEYIAWTMALYVWVISALARYARDKLRASGERSVWLYLLQGLGACLLVALLSGCAVQTKLGPGPYGWAQLNYSIIDDLNFEVKGPADLGLKVGEEGSQATQPGAPPPPD